MTQYNIVTAEGRIMLGSNVESLDEARKAFKHYTDMVGKPYPNGKGFYPDLGYRIYDASGLVFSPFIETYIELDSDKFIE